LATAPTRYEFSPQPLLWLAASFGAGICIASLVFMNFKVLLFLSGLFASTVVYFCRQNQFRVATLTLLFCFFCAGFAAGSSARSSRSGPQSVRQLYDSGTLSASDPVEVSGVIVRAPEPAPDGSYLTIAIDNIEIRGTETKTRGTIGLWATTAKPEFQNEYALLDLRYGTRIRVLTQLDREERFRNPGVISRKAVLDRQGLDATGVIKNPLLVERLGDERVLLPLSLAYEWRAMLLHQIQRTFSAETAGVLEAALLGNQFDLSKNMADRFRESGTFHALVISGFHIAILGLVIFWLVSQLTQRRILQFLIPVVIVWTFTIAIGAGPSIIRAALVFTLLSFGPIVHRQSGSLNGLGAAGLMLLLFDPSNIFDPSFHLTFLSVLSIVVIAWPIIKGLNAIGEWRPSSETPYPPLCPRWLRITAEALYWSDRKWQKEKSHSIYTFQLFKTPLARRLERLHLQPLIRLIVSSVIVSLAVQIALLPLEVIYFHRFSLASPVINLAIGPLMAVLFAVSIVAMLIGLGSGAVAYWFVFVTEKVCWLMAHLVDPFNTIGIASVRIPHYTGLSSCVYAFYFLPLLLLSLALHRWRPLRLEASPLVRGRFLRPVPLVTTALAALLLLIIFHPFSVKASEGLLRIDFLDVGQGDSALVTMPDGTTLLIDGGGKPSMRKKSLDTNTSEEGEPFYPDIRGIGDAVVSEFLWNRGLDHVDYILATHADADHIDGLSDIANNFDVRSAIVARYPSDDPEFIRFHRTMKQNHIPIEVLTRGAALDFGAVHADVLWPEPSDDADAPSQNNDSLVLRLRYGDRVFILTGDMERGAEGALLGRNENLKCDVIKIGHHGSNTSSTQEFVDATQAKFAIISVGLRSPFGHPRPEVLERWKASGARTLTTGANGTISVTTDGNRLDVETFVK
jgi:competence protein ComEC